MSDTMKAAVDAIVGNTDGLVRLTDDVRANTLVHALLFHYEHLFLPLSTGKKPTFILSGNRACAHGETCLYMLAYAVFCVNTKCQFCVGQGCCFGHSQTEAPPDFEHCVQMMTPDVIEAIRTVYEKNARRERKCKRFRVAADNGRSVWCDLPTFDDSIFAERTTPVMAADGDHFPPLVANEERSEGTPSATGSTSTSAGSTSASTGSASGSSDGAKDEDRFPSLPAQKESPPIQQPSVGKKRPKAVSLFDLFDEQLKMALKNTPDSRAEQQ